MDNENQIRMCKALTYKYRQLQDIILIGKRNYYSADYRIRANAYLDSFIETIEIMGFTVKEGGVIKID